MIFSKSNCPADNPYNYLISLSSSGAQLNVGTLLFFFVLGASNRIDCEIARVSSR